MQADDYIWDILKREFCSFKIKLSTTPERFCRNKYNASGMCSYRQCPLANSQYATVLEQEGKIYLNIKTIERAHLPKKLWEAIELSKNTKEALAQIEENLQWWSRHTVTRCKVRYLRIKQVLARMRFRVLHPGPKLVNIRKKEERVLAIREKKAHRIASLEPSIEQELLKRLREGVYDSQIPLNIPEKAFETLIDQQLDQEEAEKEAKKKRKKEKNAENEEEEEEDEMSEKEDEDYFVGDYDDDEEERVARILDNIDDEEEMEKELERQMESSSKRKSKPSVKGDSSSSSAPAAKKRKVAKPKLEVEQEHVQSASLKQLLDW